MIRVNNRTLHISAGFELPVDVAAESSAFLGKKGSGKSNGLVVLAEELYDAGVPWVAVDPKGDWYGIRSSADGNGPGLPIVVFGGKHADVPLEPGAAATVAELILDRDGSGYLTCVLDVSQMSLTDQRRFLLAFGKALFRGKDEQGVLHVFLEEAHEYLPQSPGREMAELVSTWQRIVKQGRFKGLGVTVASQRSAAVSKDVLTQVDSLYAMRVLSPQDRAAIKAWVEVHSEALEVVGTLHQLAPGECWLWSPDRWPDPQRFRFRQRRTFDSGATPKVGEVRRTPRTLADVDLDAVAAAMTDAIERAKAEDPKELRKRIAELSKDVQQAQAALAATGLLSAEFVEQEGLAISIRELYAKLDTAEPEPVEVPVPLLEEELLDRFEKLLSAAAQVGAELAKRWEETLNAVDAARNVPQRPADVPHRASERPTKRPTERPTPRNVPQRATQPAPERATKRARVVATGDPDPRIAGDGAPRRVLTALATAGLTLPDRVVAARAGVARSKSTWRNAMSRLRAWGYIEGGSELTITPAGLGALGGYEPLPEGRALCEYWLNDLGATPSRLLRVLLDAYPDLLSPEEMCERANVDRTLSTYRNAMSKLRGLDLVTTTRDAVFVNDELGKAWRG